jgi:hypothetical protein
MASLRAKTHFATYSVIKTSQTADLISSKVSPMAAGATISRNARMQDGTQHPAEALRHHEIGTQRQTLPRPATGALANYPKQGGLFGPSRAQQSA